MKKQRPPGEEIRRALLVPIGDPGGGVTANLIGGVGGGDRRPIDDLYVGEEGMAR